MLGVVVSFLLGMISGFVGTILILKWFLDIESIEVCKDDELPRTDKKNMD